jgi:hypothetical protein
VKSLWVGICASYEECDDEKINSVPLERHTLGKPTAALSTEAYPVRTERIFKN